MKYQHLVYAGTFDRLHIGHKKLLDKAFELGEKVSIGLTTNEMVKRKLLSQIIEKWEDRKDRLEEYIRNKGWSERFYFFKLIDIYGPSIEDNDFDSILVTEQTSKNAEKINEIRKEKHLKPLEIVVESMVKGDDGEIVTSERIRLGEIDRQGNNFQSSILSSQNNELKLPKVMRQELRKPLGKVIIGSVNQLSETIKKVSKSIMARATVLIAVGDIVTKSLIDEGFYPDISVVDFRSRRKVMIENESLNILSQLNSLSLRTHGQIKPEKKEKLSIPPQDRLTHPDSKKLSPSFYLENKPGTINIRTALKMKSAIKEFIETRKQQLIIVEGEEDLLALPANLFAPLGSIVLYGQFDEGIVMVQVTEETKKKMVKILDKFE